MRLVDTATVAEYAQVSTRTVARWVRSGKLTPLGQYGKGSVGRPGWFFDYDMVRVEVAKIKPMSHIGS